MCEAVTLGVISGVLGVGQQFMAYQQAKYYVAFQNAQNNLNYQSQLLQTQSNRMTEDVRNQMNEDFIQHTEFMADLANERDSTRSTMEQQQIQEQRAQEKLMDADIQKEPINVQKSIADDKLEVAIDRLKQNADLKLLELESKLRR